MPGLGSCATDLSVLGMNGAGQYNLYTLDQCVLGKDGAGQYNLNTTDQSIVGKDGAGQYNLNTTDQSVLGKDGAGQYNLNTLDQSILVETVVDEPVVSDSEVARKAVRCTGGCNGTGRTLFGPCIRCPGGAELKANFLRDWSPGGKCWPVAVEAVT